MTKTDDYTDLASSALKDAAYKRVADDAELTMLRTIMALLIQKATDARGKNVSVRLDSIFSAFPEMSIDNRMAWLNAWYANYKRAIAEAEEAERARKDRIASAALAKLTPDEIAALGLAK